MGGSFALAVRHHYPDVTVVGFDRPSVIDRAIALGVVHQVGNDVASAVSGADLVYIALPIGPAIEALPTVAAAARQGALITDACSTKTAICRVAREKCHGDVKFLGGHPIAGQESSGIEHADRELFRGAPYALIGREDDNDSRVMAFTALLRTIGASPEWCDAETHDWAVGIVSHLPQLLSIALAQVVRDETHETGLPLSLAGRGLRDVLRLAGSPYSVWRDICLTNADNISRALDRLAQAIDHLRTRLTNKELEMEFAAANELYKILNKSR